MCTDPTLYYGLRTSRRSHVHFQVPGSPPATGLKTPTMNDKIVWSSTSNSTRSEFTITVFLRDLSGATGQKNFNANSLSPGLTTVLPGSGVRRLLPPRDGTGTGTPSGPEVLVTGVSERVGTPVRPRGSNRTRKEKKFRLSPDSPSPLPQTSCGG